MEDLSFFDWDKVKQTLLRQARLKGMCNENLSALRACYTREQAIDLYKKTIDWALENEYPSLEHLRLFFADCEAQGVYVDADIDITVSEHQVYVFHNCRGYINVEMDYDKEVIPMLYFANRCEVTISCEQEQETPIRVPIYVLGDNDIATEETDNAIFKLYYI